MTRYVFEQKTAYEMLRSLVRSETCIRDSTHQHRVTCLGAVKKHTFFKRLTAMGKWKAFKTQINKTVAVADLYNNSHELDINDPDVIELSPLIKTAVGVTDEEYNSLFEV